MQRFKFGHSRCRGVHDDAAPLHVDVSLGINGQGESAELHVQGVRTPTGKEQWSPGQVRRLLARDAVVA